MFNNRQLRRVSQLKAFTGAPLQPFVRLSGGCIQDFMISLLPPLPSFCILFFLLSLSFSASPILASSPRLLLLWPLVIVREIFLVYQHSRFPTVAQAVCSSCYFHPVTSRCHILYCVSYKDTHNGSQSLIFVGVLSLPRYTFIILWHVKIKEGRLRGYDLLLLALLSANIEHLIKPAYEIKV